MSHMGLVHILQYFRCNLRFDKCIARTWAPMWGLDAICVRVDSDFKYVLFFIFSPISLLAGNLPLFSLFYY